MTYIKTDTFLEIAIQHDYDAKAILAYIQANVNASYSGTITSINNRIANYRRKGLLPLDSGNFVSLGEVLKGSSTLYDNTGAIKQQWVKTDVPKQQQLDAFESAITTLTTRLPAAPVTTPPTITQPMEDLMSIYTLGDAHIGMLAWAPESGEDNDLQISEARHIKAMEMLVAQSQPTAEAFIIDVGDFFHSDNSDNRTAASGHSLDVDGRYAKVLEVGLFLTTKLIDLALTKHSVVRWRSAIGNHNEHSALMMNQFIKAYYRNEPRVIVHDSPSTFMYHKFGKNLIGVTHGNKAKAEKLGEIMAVDAKEHWSDTDYHYWYTGHVHHQSIKEFPSCVVETFRTLASKDAWHSAMGYRSGQDMKCITLHTNYGEISRVTVNIKQLS